MQNTDNHHADPPALAAAYRTQQAFAAGLGWRQSGWKVAATNAPAQQKRGITEPVYGRLFDERTFVPPATVDAGLFADPYLEIEFAFRFARGLPAAQSPYTAQAVADAIGALVLAVEIVDGRSADWLSCPAPPLVADNVAHGATVLGTEFPDWRGLDLAAIGTTLWVDGVERAAGAGAAVLGNPLNAVVWLANRLALDGEAVSAGQVVLSGTTIAVVQLATASRVEARFAGLGSLFIDFTR